MRRTSAAWIGVAIVLAGALFWESARLFPDQLGYDMYHPWGIAAVHGEIAAPANPYAGTRRYAEAMRAYALQGDSAKAHLAEDFWRGRTAAHIEPTGTPLYYALLSILPRDYDRAHLAVALVQFACTAFAIVLLLRLRGVTVAPALCVALVVELTYNPFIQDVKMANANSPQLAAFAGLIYLSATGALERRPWLDRLYLAALALLVVIKPNILWIAGGLAAHYAVRRGMAATFRGSLIAAVAALAGIALGAWYFGAAGAWIDWLRYVGGHGGSLLYSLDGGNQSVAMLMAEKTGGYDAYTYSAILVCAMALAIVVCLSEAGQRPELLRPAAVRVLQDPWLVASLAVVITCATAPLVWPHYFLLNLIPIGWLATRGQRTHFAMACAALSFLTQCKPFIVFLGIFHLSGVISSMMAFTWAPLLPPLLLELVKTRAEVAAARA
ncbi:MAG TPA: hypothetical protein VFE23_12250 [Usitatibacter sp.]|nr:hypothetical protein [Usitatibacter sp.]